MDRQISLEEQRQIQLEILKHVDYFCKENSIQYSLAFGTLLGAVRHKGYIPWDDDIDIMMTRDNYEKFRNTYKSDRYPLADLKTNQSHPVPMGKIYDSQTYFYYRKNIKREYGLFIDVFPFDKVPDNFDERMKWLKSVKTYIRYNSFKNNIISYSLSSSSLKGKLFGCFVKLFFSRGYIHKKMEDLYVKYNNVEEYHNLSVPAVMVMSKRNQNIVFPEILFKEYASIVFEGTQYQCIKDFDSFLSIYYGNYMELPPIEQRVGKHGIVAFYK
jgi:lipopolysaccharide cholinephosphotransferase